MNHYDFVDLWTIPDEQSVVESALMHYEHWADWWDGLEKVEHHTDNLGVGAKFL